MIRLLFRAYKTILSSPSSYIDVECLFLNGYEMVVSFLYKVDNKETIKQSYQLGKQVTISISFIVKVSLNYTHYSVYSLNVVNRILTTLYKRKPQGKGQIYRANSQITFSSRDCDQLL